MDQSSDYNGLNVQVNNSKPVSSYFCRIEMEYFLVSELKTNADYSLRVLLHKNRGCLQLGYEIILHFDSTKNRGNWLGVLYLNIQSIIITLQMHILIARLFIQFLQIYQDFLKV